FRWRPDHRPLGAQRYADGDERERPDERASKRQREVRTDGGPQRPSREPEVRAHHRQTARKKHRAPMPRGEPALGAVEVALVDEQIAAVAPYERPPAGTAGGVEERRADGVAG